MEFMLDTVNLAEIKKWAQILPLAGVTSNPTIIKREGELDFFEHLKKFVSSSARNRAYMSKL